MFVIFMLLSQLTIYEQSRLAEINKQITRLRIEQQQRPEWERNCLTCPTTEWEKLEFKIDDLTLELIKIRHGK